MSFSKNLRQTTSILVSASFLFSQVGMAQEAVQRGGTHTNQKVVDFNNPGLPPMTDVNIGGSMPSSDPTGGIGGIGDGGVTEPGINIPNLPPANPGGFIPTNPINPGIPGGIIGGTTGYYPPNSPYAPWNPYNNYGNNWKPGMIAIEQSMVPGVVCPLVDNRPHIELMTAINNLFNYVLPDDNCYASLNDKQGNNGGFGGFGQMDPQTTDIAKQMRDAGTVLTGYYNQVNSGTLDPNTVDLGAIQTNIGTLVSGIDRLGRVVANNPLIGGRRCGQSKMRMGQFLKSMGDLVTSLAPYALLLAAGASTGGIGAVAAGAGAGAAGTATTIGATVAGSSALKYVLGAFTVGSVAKVYSDMIDQDAIDMEKQDQREALLQNLCEYFRIEQRVNYLKLADMGQIRNINERMKIANQRLNQFKQRANKALAQVFPPRVMQIASIEDDLSAQLSNFGKSIKNAKKEMSELTKLNTGADNQSLCSTGQMLADEAASNDSFAGKTVETYNAIMKKQTKVTFAQRALLNSEKKIRATLQNKTYMDQLQDPRQCGSGTNCVPFSQCAEIAKGYVGTLQKILTDADLKIHTLQTSLEVQLTKDPEYKEFKITQAVVKKEVVIRENTGKLVAMLSNDNAAIVYGEINRQMDVLKRALMSSKWNRKSPVTKWLESSEDQFSKSLNVYKHESNTLEMDAIKVTSTYKGEFLVVGKDGRTRLMNFADIEKQILGDIDAVNKLGMINLKVAPVGTERNQIICQKLQSMNLRWHTTIGHLKAEKFFCDNIKTMIDAIVDPSIKNICYGKVNAIDGTVYKKSTIESDLLSLSKSYGDRARTVDSKFRELKCETKDAPQVMQ